MVKPLTLEFDNRCLHTQLELDSPLLPSVAPALVVICIYSTAWGGIDRGLLIDVPPKKLFYITTMHDCFVSE